MEQKTQKQRDLKNILLILFTAIVGACLLTFGIISYYGPDGEYIAGHALLNPNMIERINYGDRMGSGGSNRRFMFDRTEFSYFNSQENKTIHLDVSLPTYQKIYDIIASDTHVSEPSKSVLETFLKSKPALLQTFMQEVGSAKTTKQTQLFQVMQIADTDYYRIQLHPGYDKEEWIYFYHPGFYQELMKFFSVNSK